MRTNLDHSQISRFSKQYVGASILCALLSLLFICGQTNAGPADTDLRKVLAERAAFDTDQIVALERGEPAVKVIPSNDSRDVAVCGVIALPSDPETALKAFQLSLSLKEKSFVQPGKLTDPPRIEDLASLTLSDEDIADLKTCTVGDCKLKLSAAMIERFQRSIDCNASDYKEKANQLFRLMIVEYVTAYLQKGDAALIEYADQSARISLAREQQALLTNLLYFDTAPEFVQSLKALPQQSVPVEHALSWAKINFGLKPVVVITDTSTYRSEVNGVRRVLVLSKQIYANHYFDASLSLISVTSDRTQTKSNLLYVNHTRTDALANSFSRLKHKMVESRATEDLRNLLGQTRINLDVVLSNSSPSFELTLRQRIRKSRALQIIFWLIMLKIIGIAFYFTFRRKLPRSKISVSSKHSDDPDFSRL